jgi:hypothetical protein
MTAVRFALLALVWLVFSPPAAATDRVSSLGAFCNGADALDDTACIQAWLAASQTSGDRDLYVPPGTYLYSSPVPLHSDLHIRCAGPGASIFQNGRNADGTPRPGNLFSATAAVHNVIVENCGFDVRGGTANFLSVIAVNSPTPSSNIHVRGNRVFDSAEPAAYTTPQRQYILLVPCNDCWIENNMLWHGGRIKVGRPGMRLHIRNNFLHETNDNAITVVDLDAAPDDSRHLLIEGNIIAAPLRVGIFFGADGQSQGSPSMRAFNVIVSRNIVRGDWEHACIRGVLPSQARRIHVTENICVKHGPKPSAGIDILRPDGTHPPAEDVLVGSNTIAGEGNGELDSGGIFVRGSHKGFRVVGNSVRNIGARALRFSGNVQDALVADNTFGGGGVVVLGSFSGQVANNLILEPSGLGMQIQMAGGEKITASIRQNVIRQAGNSCINFNGPGTYEVDLVDNTFASCGGASPVTVFGGAALAPGFLRLHNKGDTAPHATPRRHRSVVVTPDPAFLPNGATVGRNVTVSGARPGDIAGAGFQGMTGNFQLSANVVADDTVRVVITNRTGSIAVLNGRLRVHVWSFD